MSAKDYSVEKKYKQVAPDGGWGYMIAVAVVLNFATASMFQGSFGLLYSEFMDEIGMTSTHMTLMLGIAAICAAVAGFLASPLLRIMSIRMLTLMGATIFNIGIFAIVFVNAIFPFMICVGVLQGIGFGILFNISYTILNEYFVEKRLVMIGITQTLVGLLAMIAPMFAKWALDEYGFRGTMLLITGLSMQNFFAASIMQPVELHMKRVEILDNEMKTLISNEKSKKTVTTPVIKLSDIEGNAKNNEKCDDLEDNVKKSKFRLIFDLLFDESLRTTFLPSCVLLGPSFCMFIDATYIYMLPQALYAAKWSQHDVTLALSLMGFGDLATRMLLIFISKWMLKLGSQEVYISGIGLALVSRLGMLWSKSVILNLIYITLAGIAHCSIAILSPVVIADVVPPHKFPAAIGMFMLMIGVVNLIMGPAIGAVRDLSGSYRTTFYLLASCFATVILFWLIELCYKRNQHKRIQRREYLKQKKLNRG